MLTIKGLLSKDLKRCVFKAEAFSFCFLTSILMFATPANSQPERVGTIQQPYRVGPPPILTRAAKNQAIYVDICGQGLPASQADRENLQRDFRNAVLAWMEPMRIFGSPITTRVDTGICGSNTRTRTRTVRQCEYAVDIRRVECIRDKEEELIPLDLKVVIETEIPPDNRSYYSPDTKTIHFLVGSSYDIALHEVGHAIGLGDTYAEGGFFCDIHHSQFAPASTSVMCNANFSSLQPDDIAGAQHIYCTVFPSDCRGGVLTVEDNIDRPGQDYTNFELSSANYRLCYDRCARDNNCRAYTYVPPGVQGSNARCWLKNKTPASAKVQGMVSGYKP